MTKAASYTRVQITVVTGKSIVHSPCTAQVLVMPKNQLISTTTLKFKFLSRKVEPVKKADFIAYFNKILRYRGG